MALTTRRVLAIASGGGHWIQMRRLAPAFEGLDVAYVSVLPGYAADVPGHRFYAVHDVTRWDRWKLVLVVLQLTRILIKERPQVVVTTGSGPGVITLTLAKTLLRAKTIWIDSIANCERMSSSGLQARRVADIWLTQWPELQGESGPQYWGSVL
jgi:UDP-N-acetylglucosamine:LPS N-acetylglucosamine transferase